MGKLLPVIQRKQLYSEYYAEADAILKKYNPCQISADGKSCTGGEPCCDGCSHLKATGCTVMALGCKVWLCVTASTRYPECYNELKILAVKAIKDGIPLGYRTSKAESFDLELRKTYGF